VECLRSADHVSSAGPGELRRDDHHRHEAQRRPHDCPSNGIVIGAGDITLDLNGHTVDFFTASGVFGSLDQFQNQVDDGTYVIVDSNTFMIGDATFDYRIDGGNLALTPVITDKQRREALRNPWDFSTAGWMVAVTYPGTTWNRVACQGWC
jgi:hypothetical protein